ncbi:aminoglycoside phosphotransferase family protein [Nonomuraea sp. NPDC059007]|uniref:aminoglycoside phosphotransferase family protein n=1 Tax=Nonomuraea sp. NPDC059007 TaxID=3346692 RepID=UPI0036D15C58
MESIELAILDAGGTGLLELDGARPSIAVEKGIGAGPREITEAMRRQLGITGMILRVAGPNTVEVEYTGTDGRPPSGSLTWRRADPEQAGAPRMWWQRPGAVNEALAAVDAALAARGIERIGPPAQMRNISVTSLLRVPTDRGPLWLKMAPPLFAHEAGVIDWIAGTGTVAVPRVVARGARWWLAEAFPEERTPASGDPLLAMATVQQASVDRTGELIARGCPDRPLRRLAGDVADLAARRDLVTAEERRRLMGVLPRFAGIVADVDALGFPQVVVHADLHPGNVLWTGETWFLFDWTDSCVTHPMVELAMPLSYDTSACSARRAARYADRWRGWVPDQAIATALQAAPAVGAGHLAVSYGHILRAVGHHDGSTQTSRDLLPWFRRWIDALCVAVG